MNIKIILTLLSILIVTGCGSRDSDDQQKKGTDTTETTAMPAEGDTLVTKKFTEEADTTGLIEKSGTLNYSGSEPFVTPTIFVSDTETYRLAGDKKFMKETFKEINGKNATIYGKEKTTGNFTLLEVHYYEIREEN